MAMKIAQDHPESKPFVEAVGKLIQNLGMIEIQSYDWISAMQTDPMVLELARRSKFRDRVEVIKSMIRRNADISEDDRSKFIEIWSLVVPHSEVRNVVAHSCVVMGFQDDDPAKPATVKGVINLKPKDKSKEAELISVEEINGSVNATSRLGAAILEAARKLQAPLK